MEVTHLSDDLQHVAGAGLVVEPLPHPQVAPRLVLGGRRDSGGEDEVSPHRRVVGREELAVHAPATITISSLIHFILGGISIHPHTYLKMSNLKSCSFSLTMKEATRASGGVVSGRRTTRGELGEKQEELIKCTICTLDKDFYTLNSLLSSSKRDELTIYIRTG